VSQVSIDRSRDRVASILLEGPTLFVQSNHGLIHAVDSQTGGTQWVSQIGDRYHPSSAPAANEQIVAVTNGTTLYVADRANGRIMAEHKLQRIPSNDVAVGKEWIYVPTISGQLEVFPIDPKGELREWNNASLGRIDTPPLVTRKNVVWGTQRGFVYFCAKDKSSINFRLDTGGPIAAPLAYWPPIVLVASRDTYIYAVDENNGEHRWRYPLGSPISRPPIVIDGAVYLMPQDGGMHCLSCDDGSLRWFSTKAQSLLAASATRLYAADRSGNTLVLDTRSGGHLDTINTQAMAIKYTNIQTDRLYYASPTGMVMCLHEVEAPEPIAHLLPEEKDPAAAKEPATTAEPAAEPAPAENNAFGGNP
jgi:outer membrane protein assembly factor BamB